MDRGIFFTNGGERFFYSVRTFPRSSRRVVGWLRQWQRDKRVGKSVDRFKRTKVTMQLMDSDNAPKYLACYDSIGNEFLIVG